MDYEKKYNEALNWMRKLYPGLHGATKEDAEHYFPELRESEGERVIEEIKFAIMQMSSGREDTKQRCLAWLEKQKEQKPESCDCSRDEESYTNGIHHVLMNPEAYGLIKQKSAEWSEFDKGALKDAICAADRLGNDESLKKSNPNLAKAFRVAKDWLKSLPERFTLQPEQEVVDRTVFDRIADILRWCDLPIGCPIEDFKQSESEREHLLHIVQCVAHRYANSCTYCKEYSRGYQDGLAVPHWKPSEEEVRLINTSISFLKDFADKGYENAVECIDWLKSKLNGNSGK